MELSREVNAVVGVILVEKLPFTFRWWRSVKSLRQVGAVDSSLFACQFIITCRNRK